MNWKWLFQVLDSCRSFRIFSTQTMMSWNNAGADEFVKTLRDYICQSTDGFEKNYLHLEMLETFSSVTSAKKVASRSWNWQRQLPHVPHLTSCWQLKRRWKKLVPSSITAQWRDHCIDHNFWTCFKHLRIFGIHCWMNFSIFWKPKMLLSMITAMLCKSVLVFQL